VGQTRPRPFFLGHIYSPPPRGDGPVHGLSSVNSMSPNELPPEQRALKLPVGQTALAARTHCSHRNLEMVMVAPLSTGAIVNFAVRDWPTVDDGAPRHFCTEPAMPPQMASSATFWSWKTTFLRG
jgi:hypothetical protein